MDLRSLLRWVINPWVVGGALLLAILLLLMVMGVLWFTRPGPASVAQTTAVLRVTDAPTSTPVVPTPTPQPTPTEAAALPPSPAPGTLNVGAYVQISGTGGDGLRLRVDPGLTGEVRLLAAEAEVFQISEGPKEVDGYTWWYLVGPYDPARRGWGVANFLTVVQGP